VKEGLEAARLDADEARRDTDRERRSADARSVRGEPWPTVPSPVPVPFPMPKMPTITGGKLVTGTLNGGGPEISISTMNGDVTLRKLAPPK
jgi:hypothetical protein